MWNKKVHGTKVMVYTPIWNSSLAKVKVPFISLTFIYLKLGSSRKKSRTISRLCRYFKTNWSFFSCFLKLNFVLVLGWILLVISKKAGWNFILMIHREVIFVTDFPYLAEAILWVSSLRLKNFGTPSSTSLQNSTWVDLFTTKIRHDFFL